MSKRKLFLTDCQRLAKQRFRARRITLEGSVFSKIDERSRCLRTLFTAQFVIHVEGFACIPLSVGIVAAVEIQKSTIGYHLGNGPALWSAGVGNGIEGLLEERFRLSVIALFLQYASPVIESDSVADVLFA